MDSRTLEPVKNNPGIYRRHANGCTRGKTCSCPYFVRWKQGSKSHKRMFPTLELAREHKSKLGAGTRSRKPQTKATVAVYFAEWLPRYRGRTSKGLDDATREEYARSFKLHILPLPIARIRLRDLDARDVNDWLEEVERRGASPWTIRNAKAALGAMLATAVQFEGIERNVSTGVRYVPTEEAKQAHPIRTKRQIGVSEITSILEAAPVEWRCFFMLLAQTGLRVSEAIGLTWGHLHLGDDPHIMVVEQYRRGKRKSLKTEGSEGRVPLSTGMASELADRRPYGAAADTPVFPSEAGTPLSYSNVLRRVLHPALIQAGLAVKVGEVTVKRRDGSEELQPVWDYQGIGFHAFRRACASLLHAEGDHTLVQIQGWLRHAQLATTERSYIKAVDGLGGADLWDRHFPRDAAAAE